MQQGVVEPSVLDQLFTLEGLPLEDAGEGTGDREGIVLRPEGVNQGLHPPSLEVAGDMLAEARA